MILLWARCRTLILEKEHRKGTALSSSLFPDRYSSRHPGIVGETELRYRVDLITCQVQVPQSGGERLGISDRYSSATRELWGKLNSGTVWISLHVRFRYRSLGEKDWELVDRYSSETRELWGKLNSGTVWISLHVRFRYRSLGRENWDYCIQGKFRPRFIFALFALWREGKFQTGSIELYIKDYIRKLKSGRIQDWVIQSWVFIARK